MEKIKVGKIVASFGINGEVILQHNLGKKSTLKNVEAVFIELSKNNFIPYFFTSAKAKTVDETLLQFDDIKTKEATKLVIGKNVWLTNADFQNNVAAKTPIALLQFDIYNEDEFVGKVEEVIEQPHQILLTTTYRNNQAYLPLHEETIDKIDYKKREVYLTLPDGLLEIYSSLNTQKGE